MSAAGEFAEPGDTGATGEVTADSARANSETESPRVLDPNRWKILALLGSIQFMLLLDATVVSVALPPIQRDLGFTQEGLSWVLNAYVLSSGGFLLLGGRLADVFGRRRMFLAGMVAFGLGSAMAAAAWAPNVLVAARFIQGFGEAFAAPAALGIIAVLFTDPFERIRALSIWGGLAGAGGAAGSVVGGFITSFASWHWLFLINIPITIAAFLGVLALVKRMATHRGQPVDVIGALTSTSALGLIIFAVLQAVSSPITSPSVALPALAGVGAAVAFVVNERRSPAPLIPHGFFSEPVRRASNILVALGAAVFASYPFAMTLYAQHVLGYTPLQVGFMMLPLIGSLALGLVAGSHLLKRWTMRRVAVFTGLTSAAGLAWTSLMQTTSTFLDLLGSMILFGLAIGVAMPLFSNGALYGTTAHNSSLASAIQTAAQQAGSALGLALLAAIAAGVTTRFLEAGMAPDAATTGGFAIALRLGAGLSLVSAGVAMLLLPAAKASDAGATALIGREGQ